MREIKLRAWVTTYSGGNIMADVLWINFREHVILADNGLQYTDYKLMQSTGLPDKNGDEIYEGDIVECTHWFFDGNEIEEHFTAYVGFRGGSFTLEGIRSKFYSDYTGEKPGTGTCWIGDINYDESDYEVIGNIFEHPELLK